MKHKLIEQGAEARIFLSSNFVVKDRIPKGYRHPILDKKIIKRRTKSEAKLLTKAAGIIDVPKPFFIPMFTKIKMPFIPGKKLSEHLDTFTLAKQKLIMRELGQKIAKLHSHDIIHGDLTTSNMILHDTKNNPNNNSNNSKDKSTNNLPKKSLSVKNQNVRSVMQNADAKQRNASGASVLYIIDFGLGFQNGKFEDKAVDLHLLKEALEAKHFQHHETLFKEFLKSYTNKNAESKKVLERLRAVEKRGRYKDKY